MLVGIALCGAVPAFASEFQPRQSSFAYTASHFYTGMPFDYAVLVNPAREPETEPDGQASADETPAAILSRHELCSTAASAAAANRIPVRFFANLIQQESGFKPHVVSSAGAQGIAQFMPEVAAEQGLHNPFDPVEALRASAKFISNLVERFGNVGLAAAAYNAGSRRVSDWLKRRGRLPAETRDYVRKITGRPAEKWVRVRWTVAQLRLPTRAECPELQVAVAAAEPRKALVKARSPIAHGRARLAVRAVHHRVRVAAATHPVRIAANHPARHPAHHRLRLAAQ
jgi:hypothetical protein